MRSDHPRSVLYRYFFFGWLFRDAAQGNLFERTSAWRHNQAQSHWLPTYLRRWVGLSLFWFATGCLSTLVFEAHWFSTPFYILFSIATSISSIILVAWLGLKFLPSP